MEQIEEFRRDRGIDLQLSWKSVAPIWYDTRSQSCLASFPKRFDLFINNNNIIELCHIWYQRN